MTAVILPFRSPTEIEHAAAAKELASLSPVARTFAEGLMRLMPRYEYNRSRLPRLDPPPGPGLPSAVAAAKAVWIKAGRR